MKIRGKPTWNRLETHRLPRTSPAVSTPRDSGIRSLEGSHGGSVHSLRNPVWYVLRFRDFPEPILWPGRWDILTIHPPNFLRGNLGSSGLYQHGSNGISGFLNELWTVRTFSYIRGFLLMNVENILWNQSGVWHWNVKDYLIICIKIVGVFSLPHERCCPVCMRPWLFLRWGGFFHPTFCTTNSSNSSLQEHGWTLHSS